MTISTVDASIRRQILPEEETASPIRDSKTVLEIAPQLLMEPGVERPAFKFDDGGGLTDAFGNVYEGYGGAGGSSSIVVNDGDYNPLDPDDIVDGASDLDILVFNLSTEKYEPHHTSYLNLIQTDGAVAADLDILVFDFASSLYIQRPLSFFNVLQSNGTPAVLDQVPVFDDVGGNYIPRDIDYFPVALTDGTAENDEEVLVYSSGVSKYIPRGLVSFFRLIQMALTQTIELGDILVADGVGNFKSVPQVTEDFISGIIEVPQSRTYTIIQNLPYDITITGVHQSRASGTGVISFPSGSIASGASLVITVSGVSGNEEFLRFQIDFTRDLGIA